MPQGPRRRMPQGGGGEDGGGYRRGRDAGGREGRPAQLCAYAYLPLDASMRITPNSVTCESL